MITEFMKDFQKRIEWLDNDPVGGDFLFENIKRMGEYNDPRTVEPLIDVLKGNKKAISIENSSVRAQAAHELGGLNDERAVGPLIEALKNDKFESVKRAAAESLGKLKDYRAVNPLIEVLENTDSFKLKSKICEALGNLSASEAVVPIFKVVEEVQSLDLELVAGALASLSNVAYLKEYILAYLWFPNNKRYLFEAICSILENLTTEQILRADFGSWSYEAAYLEIHGLGTKEDDNAIQHLVDKYLKSDRAELRIRAVEALGNHMDNKKVEQEMIKALDRETNGYHYEGRSGDVYIDNLGWRSDIVSTSGLIRRELINHILATGSKESMGVLSKALNDSDEKIADKAKFWQENNNRD